MAQRNLFLITGIPGTGKTTYGQWFADHLGFAHLDFEDSETLSQCLADPKRFIQGCLQRSGSTVVTWGFLPNQAQIAIVSLLKTRGFTLFWFDGNRPAALKAFQRRGTISEELFYLQMYRIENTRVIDAIKPVVIDPFSAGDKFKPPRKLFEEMRRAAEQV